MSINNGIVKISEIIQLIEMTEEGSCPVYSKKDKVFIWIDEFSDLSADDIEYDDNYIMVIDAFDKRNIYVESQFIETLDGSIYITFNNAFDGRGKYRRFKDCLTKYHLWDAFNDFEQNIYKEYVLQWCKDNQIEYTDDTK